VLLTPLDGTMNAVRADRKATERVVLTPEEVKLVISVMEGVPQLIVKMLYGSGLRIMEAVRLSVKDVDFQMKQVTVRAKVSPAHWTI
jgi:integrase